MRLAALILALFVFAPLPACAEDNGELVKVVVLSRHGLRAPTQSPRILSMWSQKTWPDWPVSPGDLTPRGAMLVTAMWANLRESLAAARLLDAKSCPQQSSVYVRADVDERTKATAKAILEGLAPGCALKFRVSEEKIDPLFHPVRAGLYHYDAIPAATAVIASTNGGLERLADEFSGAITVVGEIAGPPASSLCARFALMPQCELGDLPNAVSVSPDGANIRVVGSLGIASSLAEIFLLEYGEWPNEAAGWGRVNGRVLSQIMPVHSKIFDVINRTPVIAWANGGALLAEMSAALFGEHVEKGANEAKLVVFVGHDTNIANVCGLLGFYWQASGYPPNGIPPASAVFLELWRKNGKDKVIAKFYCQPPEVLHTPFTGPELTGHAAKSARMYAGTEPAPVDMQAASFRALVRKVTENAPAAPAQKLRELAQ